MNLLGISGSPRIGGNTDILLDKALEGAKSRGASTEKVILNTLKFSPCQECEKVKEDGTCKIEDDMQIVYRKIEEADALILAAPIFFGSLSAQAKMMIDRFQCLWLAKYVFKTSKSQEKRPGAFICVEGTTRKDFFENARSIVKNFLATVDVAYQEELLCSGVDRKGAILRHQDCLKRAFQIGETFSLKKTKKED